MPARPGLKRPAYNGTDTAVDQFARAVNDSFKMLQTLPANDGVIFENMDFGAQSATTTQQLKHTMNRKARGISVFSCRPRAQSLTTPGDIPSHAYWLDDENIAYIVLTAGMASDYLWSFWVW
jgi:hypothetical protein